MHYYNPNDRKPRRWALAATALYASLLAAAFLFVTFDAPASREQADNTIEIAFVEPEPPQPPVEVPTEPRVHESEAPEEAVAQTEGTDEQTRTPNPRALFRMNRSGADEPENAGNPHAREGQEQNAGKGPGLDADGLNQLDLGLQGRGLVGSLPRPDYPGQASGKVVIRISVGPEGEVKSAAFEPKGSTTNDARLVEAAIRAARKARFTESSAAIQGGTITYVFRME